MIRQITDMIVANGLAAAETVVCVKDCWQISRASQGTIQVDPKAFSTGILAGTDYIHSRKLKFGLYLANIDTAERSYTET
ncbi:unnamed protein product [Rotaria sp. Silwood1]|nr:unnamed protein product [Rotaria sp. Silwood1]CAF1631020.1 unnamed protein product [Rotaria sp. Silwood1]CAF3344606.1 unnamed protein product [Rotaria sp. Silwood1]CAF3746384.1 unnamed protein product [Rotaria sp. Silwood1]CAF4689033.1 unnamed protein product [Rotaria sp. Silwood1]